MKRFLVALLLVCAPIGAEAQVAYSFTDFVQSTSGSQTHLGATLLFRNITPYSAPRALGISNVLVGVTKRVSDFCTIDGGGNCDLNGNRPNPFVGPVQFQLFATGGMEWHPTPAAFYSNGCIGCITQGFGTIFDDVWALGCALPQAKPNTPSLRYAGRTCDDEGYTGFLAIKVGFWINQSPNPMPQFDVSDFTASFSIDDLGPTVTPEPSTWAMMLVGLGAIGVLGRRTRRALRI